MAKRAKSIAKMDSDIAKLQEKLKAAEAEREEALEASRRKAGDVFYKKFGAEIPANITECRKFVDDLYDLYIANKPAPVEAPAEEINIPATASVSSEKEDEAEVDTDGEDDL